MHTEPRHNNHLTLLCGGNEYFPALLAAIQQAEQEIFLETYIFADDCVGRALARALCQAAARGVSVFLTVDGFGGRNFRQDFLPQLETAGVRALLYRPEKDLLSLRLQRLRRLHRKLAVIDGRIGFVGGINIVDDHNAPPGMAPRFDFAVRLEGPLVSEMRRTVWRLWELASWVQQKRRPKAPPMPATPLAAGHQMAEFLIRDNVRHRHDILNAYLGAIQSARDSILIANAYFLPGMRFGRALLAAARRGVQVRILLQGKTDHPWLRQATQMLYSECVQQGIQIFEYDKSFLHAKVAVIDDRWATVGSSNIDPFSLLLAKEANLVIHDEHFARTLRDQLEHALRDGARKIHPELLKQRRWFQRLGSALSYGLIRLLVGLNGRLARAWHEPDVPKAYQEE